MFKGHCLPRSIILQAVYFKFRFSLSYREIEELLSIRGVKVDHATIQRWVFKFSPLIEKTFRKGKRPVGNSWKMDETYIKVKGEWMYLYRAIDKQGNTIDFLLTKRRNTFAAHRFLIQAIERSGLPVMINIDKSVANKQAIRVYNKRNYSKIKIRQCKYMNNPIEQDHRFIKWRIQNMLDFKNFESAERTLSGIEVVRMIKKNQLVLPMSSTYTSFCSLAV